MNKRGIIYIYWGNAIEKELSRSIDSLKRFHPELPFECFKIPEGSSLLDKSKMLESSPYETTLYLDTDTVVMDRLDYGFEKAEKHNLACCINECPWARRYGDISGDQIEYNTGVIFFTKTAKPVFDRWKALSPTIDSSIVFKREGKTLVMPHNDQAGFSQAVEDTGINPFVLPMNWNYRPAWQTSFFGPVKIWHDRNKVQDGVKFWNEHQRLEQSIIQYTGDSQ